MNHGKMEKLKQAGWKVGTTQEFLGLSDEEAALIEIKLALAKSLKEKRLSCHLTQAQMATKLGSSQSRVAKMEAADISVSIELMVRSILVLGATRQEIGHIIGQEKLATAV